MDHLRTKENILREILINNKICLVTLIIYLNLEDINQKYLDKSCMKEKVCLINSLQVLIMIMKNLKETIIIKKINILVNNILKGRKKITEETLTNILQVMPRILKKKDNLWKIFQSFITNLRTKILMMIQRKLKILEQINKNNKIEKKKTMISQHSTKILEILIRMQQITLKKPKLILMENKMHKKMKKSMIKN